MILFILVALIFLPLSIIIPLAIGRAAHLRDRRG